MRTVCRLIGSEQPDLVLLDLMLPDLDGREICRLIRGHKDQRLATTPILMLTALTDASNRVAGLSVGADDHATKPFSVEEVELRASRMVARRRAEGGFDDPGGEAGGAGDSPAQPAGHRLSRGEESTPHRGGLLVAAPRTRGAPAGREGAVVRPGHPRQLPASDYHGRGHAPAPEDRGRRGGDARSLDARPGAPLQRHGPGQAPSPGAGHRGPRRAFPAGVAPSSQCAGSENRRLLSAGRRGQVWAARGPGRGRL
ncbi:MAG: response regulator [Deltaproteobacteria bacterium]|nr:response regulator [Deltaproteobacteria bacterium]